MTLPWGVDWSSADARGRGRLANGHEFPPEALKRANLFRGACALGAGPVAPGGGRGEQGWCDVQG